MAGKKREKTKYPGVYYRVDDGGEEKTFYIMYRRGGRGSKLVEEPVGRDTNGMTAAKANQIRVKRMSGKELSNTELRAEEHAAKLTQGETITVRKLWEIYAEHHKDNPSLRGDKNRLKYLSTMLLRTPDSLTTADIDRLSKKLSAMPSSRKPGSTLSAQTVKHALELLKRILNYANKIGVSPYPSGLVFTMPKVDNEKTETMSKQQLAAYLAALDAEPDQNAAGMLRLALLTGMRRGAIFGLKWTDVDFEHGFITLQGEYAKNGKTTRIPLPPAAKEVLENVEKTESEYVFPGKNGQKRVTCQAISQRVRNRAGLPPDFRPMHALRHVYASLLVSSGVPLYTVQKLLTHDASSMTKRYAHLGDETLQNAAAVAGDIINSARS